MFRKFIDWIKRILKTISAQDDKITSEIQPVVSEDMTSAITLWSEMYANKAPWLDKTTHSLNLPSAIASEIARLVTIELKTEITGSPRANYLNEQYQRCIKSLRQSCEYGCAKGGLIFKPYIDGKNIAVDAVHADRFIPIAFDSSGNMTGAIFLEQITKGKRIYTRYELHNLTDAGYNIKNIAYSSSSKDLQGSEISLDQVDEWRDLTPEATISGVEKPLFAYFKIPQANTIDPASPLGVSVFSRAVELIMQADKQYSRMLWEFEGGELAVDADVTLFRIDETTGEKSFPKGKERLFRSWVGNPDAADKMPLIPFSPELRDKSLINGLNEILMRIEDTCGLARGSFSNPQGEAKTATELKILRQRSYATVADTQKALQTALENLIYAIDFWVAIGRLAPSGKYEVSFEWDDSVIVDTESEGQIRLNEVGAGILKPEYYLMWRYGVTEDQARKMMPNMKTLTE